MTFPDCKFREACVRCSLLRPEPSQRDRLIEIRDNLINRISEAQREDWLGEVEGLEISLAGAKDKLAQLRIIRRGSGSVVTWRRAQTVLLSAQGRGEDRRGDIHQRYDAHRCDAPRGPLCAG
ncbi:hypothetical protein [Streptomyces sp. RPT161]|uniref:hypothetical protein n=1 Tax=Streptomyces sp. RPT161 TaxID=3015993 RepID=UPI0022B8C17E|nr:hypothetical protein [Streptomyces sp. RPT161]